MRQNTPRQPLLMRLVHSASNVSPTQLLGFLREEMHLIRRTVSTMTKVEMVLSTSLKRLPYERSLLRAGSTDVMSWVIVRMVELFVRLITDDCSHRNHSTRIPTRSPLHCPEVADHLFLNALGSRPSFEPSLHTRQNILSAPLGISSQPGMSADDCS